MKRILILLSLALGALAFTGCTTGSEENGVKVEHRYFGG